MNTAHSADIGADVVIIDDEESIREGCRQTLEGEGYRAAVARDGEEGLKVIQRAKPRIVLLDLRMPGLDGIEVLERLRQLDSRIIPIVITGYGSTETAVNCMKLGAFDFISKPFEPKQLLTIVDRGMKKSGSQEPVPDSGTAAELDVVLRGLEVITDYQSLGIKGKTLEAQIAALEQEAKYHSKKLGQIHEKEKAIADLLHDLRMVDGIIEKYGFKKNTLIQILFDIQTRKNWLPRHTLLWTSRRLNIPLSKIYEVVTFYDAFSLKPQGKHTIQVCMGTACHVRHSPELRSTISALLGIQPGQTDSKMLFTLKEVHCLGCCALAPVIKIDDQYYSNPSLRQLKKIFKEYEEKKEE